MIQKQIMCGDKLFIFKRGKNNMTIYFVYINNVCFLCHKIL